jgi:hypothetical protein
MYNTGRFSKPENIAELALLGLSLTFFLSAIASLNTIDHDLFHEMATFRECLRQGRILLTDSFAYTPTVSPVIHHELGSGAIFFAVVETLGFGGLMLLRMALVAAILTCVALRARLAGTNWVTFSALSVIATTMALIGFGTIRAQLFTILFVSLELLILYPGDSEPIHKPPLFFLLAWLIWLNLHAGFVAGAGIYAACGLEAVWRSRKGYRRWGGVALVMLALVFVNPFGAEYPRYVLHAITMERPAIPEWRPIWRAEAELQGPYAASLLILFYALARNGLAKSKGVLPVLVCAIAAALHLRHLPLYAVAWIGAVPAWLEGTLLAQVLGNVIRRAPRVILLLALTAAIALSVSLVNRQAWQVRFPTSRAAVLHDLPMVYPVGAVNWLEQKGFKGNLMTPFRAGAYVSWRLAPSVKISLDGRYEVAYQPGVFESVEGFYQGDPGWIETLGRYPTDLVLARATHAVVPLLEKQAGWHRIYDDGAYMILAPPQYNTHP